MEYSKPPKPARPLRILFLHATRDESNEYKVNRRLAENVDPDYVDSMFVWQATTHNPAANIIPELPRSERVFHYDFGRNMNLPRRPSKVERAAMMIGRLPATWQTISRHIRDFNPDVIYTTQQHYEVFLAHHLGKKFGIPHVIHICYEVGPWLGRRTLDIIRHNDHVFASCQFVQNTAIREGVPAEKTEFIHHIAATEAYDIPACPEYLRQELNLPPETRLITGAARLDKGKGFPLLIKSFAQVITKEPDARLIIVGDASAGTNYDEVIKKTARDLNLDDKVYFLGFRNDLPQIFASSDIFALPLKSDAVSLVFLGAMVASLPCVSINSGSVPEVVLHEKTGFVSAPGDVDALAENILKLLRDPQLARSMGAAGRQYALSHFSAENITNWWTSLLFRRFGEKVGAQTA